jgi:hypothetical protein
VDRPHPSLPRGLPPRLCPTASHPLYCASQGCLRDHQHRTGIVGPQVELVGRAGVVAFV